MVIPLLWSHSTLIVRAGHNRRLRKDLFAEVSHCASHGSDHILELIQGSYLVREENYVGHLKIKSVFPRL